MDLENRRERGRSRRKPEVQMEKRQIVQEETQQSEQGKMRQNIPVDKNRGTKRWIILWSVLLAGIIVALCVLILRQGEGKTALTATAAIEESTPVTAEGNSAGAGASEDRRADSENAAGNSEDGNITTIAIENPVNRNHETAETTEAAKSSVRFLFAGDVYLSDHVMEAYDAAGGIDGVLSKGYQEDIQSADYFITNEEFPFSTRGTPAPDKQFTFRVNPERVKIMQEMGIDLVTLANNHALDYGRDAMLDTMKTLDDAGIRHIGAGQDLNQAKTPAVVELNGRTFAFIGATRVIPEADWAAGEAWPGLFSAYDGGAQLAEEVKAAKQQADYVIVYVHWGIEREEMPNEVQKSIAHRLVDAGADLVLGAHPHVLQGLEYYHGTPIAYSLGNFVFGSSIPSTELLQVEIDDEGIRLRLIPGTSAAGYTRKLDDSEKTAAFYEKMRGLSSGIKIDEDGNVHAG